MNSADEVIMRFMSNLYIRWVIALPLLLGSSAIARTWYPLEVFDKANVNENVYADIESIKNQEMVMIFGT